MKPAGLPSEDDEIAEVGFQQGIQSMEWKTHDIKIVAVNPLDEYGPEVTLNAVRARFVKGCPRRDVAIDFEIRQFRERDMGPLTCGENPL